MFTNICEIPIAYGKINLFAVYFVSSLSGLASRQAPPTHGMAYTTLAIVITEFAKTAVCTKPKYTELKKNIRTKANTNLLLKQITQYDKDARSHETLYFFFWRSIMVDTTNSVWLFLFHNKKNTQLYTELSSHANV